MISVYPAELGSPEGLFRYWFIQDFTSITLLLSLVSQSATLLHRGQLFPQFPTVSNSPTYFLILLILFIAHGLVLYIRALTRKGGIWLYATIHWSVWIATGIFPVLGIVLGFSINYFDSRNYRRHLQFLRLEFDTRLGMHSPR